MLLRVIHPTLPLLLLIKQVNISFVSIVTFTHILPTAPGVVQSLYFSSVSITNITIQWDRVACQERNIAVTVYRVTYYPTADPTKSNTQAIAGTSDNNRMFTVIGLPPRTSYTFEVEAVNFAVFVFGATATLTVSTSAPQSELLTFTLLRKSVINVMVHCPFQNLVFSLVVNSILTTVL